MHLLTNIKQTNMKKKTIGLGLVLMVIMVLITPDVFAVPQAYLEQTWINHHKPNCCSIHNFMRWIGLL
jgi:hypothetical protein